jgi:hypothetical protein
VARSFFYVPDSNGIISQVSILWTRVGKPASNDTSNRLLRSVTVYKTITIAVRSVDGAARLRVYRATKLGQLRDGFDFPHYTCQFHSSWAGFFGAASLIHTYLLEAHTSKGHRIFFYLFFLDKD